MGVCPYYSLLLFPIIPDPDVFGVKVYISVTNISIPILYVLNSGCTYVTLKYIYAKIMRCNDDYLL